MTSEEINRLTKNEMRFLIQIWSSINKIEDVIEDIHRRLPWANAVWLQRRKAGWIAFVRADKGGYVTSTCNVAAEAVAELWMYYNQKDWKQE